MSQALTNKAPVQPRAGILYRGPSALDDRPIILVGLWSQANRKTGGMVQTYILSDSEGMSPIEAIRTGTDSSICGDCKHRGVPGQYGTRSCYVNIAQGPTVVWKGIQRGLYPLLPDLSALGRNRMVRLGTYGDPAAVPVAVWLELLSKASGHTGYTHQWADPSIPAEFKSIVMASVDTPEERAQAVAAGWRTFRVRQADEAVMPAEFVCPASDEAGKRTDCATCLSCAGNDGRKGSPVIVAHGALARRFAANQITLRAA